MKYWEAGKLLSMKDLEGLEPSIFLVCGNRTSGKTYGWTRHINRRFFRAGEEFIVLVRNKYELDNIGEAFFENMKEKEWPNKDMTDVWGAKDIYKELYIDGEKCGYAMALSSSDNIKKYSSVFSNVKNMFMDEFMTESGKYLKNEITHFLSIYFSVARGKGAHVRDVKVFMAANTVTKLNPMFVHLGISKRLKPETKFLRGNGWVLEVCNVEEAGKAICNSGVGRAFQENTYISFSSDNTFLLDNENFIVGKVKGKQRALFNLHCEGGVYCVWIMNNGMIYVSDNVNKGCNISLATSTAEHVQGTLLATKTHPYTKTMKQAYDNANVCFESDHSRKAFIDFVGYTNF